MNTTVTQADPLRSFTRVIDGRVQVYRNDTVAVVCMNRPEKRNALDEQQITALEHSFKWLAHEDNVNVAVLTGHGQAFCAGGDISMFLELDSDSAQDFTRRGYDLLRPLETGRKPIIAAVSGYCLAGGFEIALACDFIIAGAGARFGMAEVNLGLIPGWGGTVRLGSALPVRMARQLVLTCEPLPAERARELGLVNEVLPDEAVLARAIALATHIGQQPPLAVRAAKSVLNAIGQNAETSLSQEGALAAGLFSTSAVKQRVRQWVDLARAKGRSR